MHARLGRAAIAVTLLTTLVIPAVAAPAGVRQRLQEIEERRESLEAKIERHEAEAGDLRDSIEGLNRRLTKLQIEMNRLDAQIEKVAAEVHTAQAAIDETQKEIDRVEKIATKQAVELYKSGSTDAIEALLDSESLADLDAKAELLGLAAQQNTGALVRYSRLQLLFQSQHRELFRVKEELDAQLKSRALVKSDLNKTKTKLNRDLRALNIKLEVERNKEGDLQDESDRIRGDIEAITARNSVERLGTSSQGFIWPLNGSVTSPYGYRWGRQHTGIDIDGYTGQPIVSSKEGVVILADYYYGYGLTVLVDHGGGYVTLYAHQSRIAVRNGQEVEQGDIVGYVGCSGSCTGDHLHFEVRVNGNPEDPMRYLP